MAAAKARRWIITGHVQGVGFRYFVRGHAQSLNLTGWARNLADGGVEVFAIGPPDNLNDLASALHQGPPMSDVRTVDEQEAAIEACSGFQVR